jgi:hypothetical protein
MVKLSRKRLSVKLKYGAGFLEITHVEDHLAKSGILLRDASQLQGDAPRRIALAGALVLHEGDV